MFWRFGGYASISTIDTLLDKPEVTLEELLDEGDLIQELKSHNTKLIEYLREDVVLEKLLEYVVAPKLATVAIGDDGDDAESDDSSKGKAKEESIANVARASEDDEDEQEKKRNKYAYVAAEILSSDSWSLSAALLENQTLLRKFWDFLTLSPPLDPLQASYFTKVNEALLDKKTEEMLDLFKSIDGVVKNMLQHVDSPMVMDLLLKIISLEKAEGGQGIVDWLHSQDLMPILLSFLSSEHPWATQTSAGDFLKAIITISANASQNEQSCIGPNELTRQLVSKPCVEKLISDMLKGGNPLTVGVGIVIEVIRKNNSDYDPDVGAESNLAPSSRDPIYLGTLLRMFADHVPDFMELILSPNHTIGSGDGPVTIRRKELMAAFGSSIEPLGFDRFKTCELMAELLHCSNMGLLNEVGSDEFVRARDVERERLKAEGKLHPMNGERRSSGNEDLSMRSSTMSHLGSGSAEEFRKLEVQNAADDDGFEEVTHSGDLGDDTKEVIVEKPDLEEDIRTPTQDTALSFLDKDDEEFVDEPLSSPQLKPEPDHFGPGSPEDATIVVTPLSPSKALSNRLDTMKVDEDVIMKSPPALAQETSRSVQGSAAAAANEESLKALEDAINAQTKMDVDTPGSLELGPPLLIPSTASALVGALSPHPEDKPAPLFVRKASLASAKGDPEAEATSNLSSISADAPGSTVADTDESSTPILTEASDDDHTLAIADDTHSNPVVGDYLKMQFVEHKVVPTILDFFFRFPWNNFLHNVVYDVVQQVFNGPMDRGYNRTLAIDLFDTGDITMRIVDGQRKSDEEQECNKMRLGYMGHLTLIAEEVVKFTERHPPELLSESVLEKVMNGEWITYVEVTLAETRERDNAILGGVRPDMSVGPRQAVMNAVSAASGYGLSGSSALAEAGLNGSSSLDGMDLANGHSGGFTLTAGSLLSGFGSSSDEEDEEMDEENEEDGSRNLGGVEFSRYISTPSTTTATSSSNSELDPPSAPPPPPPPLNIPPSRARRRLAARLELHSKQNTSSTPGSNGAQIEAEHRKNLNPFATDEDDEEDEQEDFTLGDLEVVAEGRGHLPTGTALTGQQEPLDDLDLELEDGQQLDDHVGSSPSNNAHVRASFPFKWPFGQLNRASQSQSQSHEEREQQLISSDDSVDDDMPARTADWKRYRRSASANAGVGQSSDESGSEESDEEEGFGKTAAEKPKPERPGVTEATRRTSLEDDDEEVVVHVGSAAGGEDTDMVEVTHLEGEAPSHRPKA